MSAVQTLRQALYGNPPSLAYKPDRNGTIEAFAQIADSINTVVGGIAGAEATAIYQFRTQLDIDLDFDAGSLGLVYNDTDPDNNGIYVKAGVSGDGSWTATGLLGRGTDGADGLNATNAQIETVLSAYIDSLLIDIEDARADAIASEAAAAISAGVASAAALSIGNVYPDTTAGLAAESEGDYFWTEELGFYREQSGMAVLKELLLTASRLGMTTPEMAGAAGDGTTDDRAALNTANVLAKVLLINKPHFVGSNLTLGRVMFGPGGLLIPDAGVTITITEIVNSDTRAQIFDISEGGAIKLVQAYDRPDWWGDIERSVDFAVDALPDAGGTVLFGVRRYKPNYHEYTPLTADAVYMLKDNIAFVGEKMARPNNDFTALEDGSIIEGNYFAFGNNFQSLNVMCDSGKAVCDAYFGGTPVDGFLTTFPSDQAKSEDAQKRGLLLENVGGLCYNSMAPVHACIIGEGYTDFTAKCVRTYYGIHGLAIKGINGTFSDIKGYCHGGESVIFKTDTQETAICADITYDTITAYADAPGYEPWDGPATDGAGVMFNPQGGDMARITGGEIRSVGHPRGVDFNYPSGVPRTIDGLQIGPIITDTNSEYGIALIGDNANHKLLRSKIGAVNARNTPTGIVCSIGGAGFLPIESIQAINCVDVALDQYPGLQIKCSYIEGEECDEGVVRNRANTKPLLGEIVPSGSTPARFASSSGGTVPALATGWTQSSGNSVFGVTYCEGRAVSSGLIVPGGGSTNTVATLPQWARPESNVRLSTKANADGTLVDVSIGIYTDGTVALNVLAAAGGAHGIGASGGGGWVSLDNLSWKLLE